MTDDQIRLEILRMAREDRADFVGDGEDPHSPAVRCVAVVDAYRLYEALVFDFEDTEPEPLPGDEDFDLETAESKGRA